MPPIHATEADVVASITTTMTMAVVEDGSPSQHKQPKPSQHHLLLPLKKWKRHHYRRLLIVVSTAFLMNYVALRRMGVLGVVRYAEPQSTTAAAAVRTLPACTKEAHEAYSKPTQVSKRKQYYVSQAEEILAYIITELHDVGAPIILMFGTMLHEFRNGTDTGPCLYPKSNDKDFDIALFPEHYHYILTMNKEIMDRFGWRVAYGSESKGRLFASIVPNGHIPEIYKFAIDLYGFECDKSNGLVYFPWDKITISMDGLLPLQRHKSVLLQDGNAKAMANHTADTFHDSEDIPRFYMPYNPPCLLENLYGNDYMTPKSGINTQAKFGTQNGRPAHGNPECKHSTTSLSENDKYELERQLAFC